MDEKANYTVALAGNPNVGKSTVFNAVTGMRQHTGNWPGKTVEQKYGTFKSRLGRLRLVDVPGTYSLDAKSPEEAVAAEYLKGTSGEAPDGVIVVCDACCLERSLAFACEVAAASPRIMLCVNLIDEAERRGIKVDCDRLGEMMGVTAVGASASKGEGIDRLVEAIPEMLTGEVNEVRFAVSPAEAVAASVTVTGDADGKDRRLDRIFTGRYTAYPIAALLLALVFFITLKGATPLSDGISLLLGEIESVVRRLLCLVGTPQILVSFLCDGVLRVLFWVCAVMLPPMAIFFPLFTIIEDFGYLPRVAYNFDSAFRRCGSCGKQSLTMMMSLGCNAVGVTGCRIIDSPRERLIAILTSSFVPCNGRLPVLAVFLTVAAGGRGGALPSLLLCAAVSAGFFMTLGVSRLLSVTLLRGEVSAFAIELPPYRTPSVRRIILRSVIDRTLKVLGRAAAVAAPAGAVIWCLGSLRVGNGNLFTEAAGFLDPAGRVLGMDGVMVLSFILALPASEITVPLMLMGYAASSALTPVGSISEVSAVLGSYGWDVKLALIAATFTLFHFPCSTTLITVKRETGGVRWMLAAAAIPTLVGVLLCAAINLILP